VEDNTSWKRQLRCRSKYI